MLKTIGTVVVLLFCALCGIPTAAATYDGITVSATADGRSVSASTSNEPIRLRPGEPVDVAIELTNPTSAPVEVRQVELVGRVVGLNFFTYATSVDFTVPPDCHLLAFRIVLGPDRTRIKGTLWMDDFQLTRAPAAPAPGSGPVAKVP